MGLGKVGSHPPLGTQLEMPQSHPNTYREWRALHMSPLWFPVCAGR